MKTDTTNSYPSFSEGLPNEVKRVWMACLDNANDLLRAAIILKKEEIPHIAYHLATLSLEEVGKSHLIVMNHIRIMKGDQTSWSNKHFDDHVKKLFWALWGPSFGNQLITKEQIESFRGMAQEIHETRLDSLYVNADIDSFMPPREIIKESELENLIGLAEACLRMTEGSKIETGNQKLTEALLWFLKATDDPEIRKNVMSQKSMDKLVELGNTREWIYWLKEIHEEAERQAYEYAQKALEEKGDFVDSDTPKWKFKIRLYSNSHSLRPKPFTWWNEISQFIKLYPVDKKAGQLLMEFTLPKRIAAESIWNAGLFIARKFTLALNISTLGYFWWYLPEQVDTFYEELIDLEVNHKVLMRLTKSYQFNLPKAAISEEELARTALCFKMLPNPNAKHFLTPFNHYISALAFISKTDFHSQFLLPAFQEFYLSFKTGMQVYKAWNPSEDFYTVYNKMVKQLIPEIENHQKYYQLGEEVVLNKGSEEKITFEEVGAMKIICDAYFIQTFKELIREESIQKPKV